MKQDLFVAALAGRRIDPVETTSTRFPKSSVPRVQSEIKTIFINERIGLLICSAASGADLLALQVAIPLRIDCRVVLPFEPKKFRSTSVTDRSEEWGKLYDDVIANSSGLIDVLVLDEPNEEQDPYARATEVIVDQARATAFPKAAIAIEVWDGLSRGNDDYVQQFKRLAQAAHMRERVVLTR